MRRKRDNATGLSPMRRVHVPLIAAAAAVVGMATSATGAATESQAVTAGTLVFATGGDGASDKLEIAAVAADGRRFRKVTHLAASGFAPRWSNDGRRILFVTEDTFTLYGANWSMRNDGGRPRRLPGLEWDVPSPSGRLVFGYDRIVDSAGKIVRRLRPGLRKDEYYLDAPLWAPDGRYVVINAARQRANSDFYDDTWVDIVPMTAGGRGRALTPRRRGRFAQALSWSPDGRRLLVAAERGRGDDWYTIRPDGTDRRLLFHVRAGLSGNHAWSPDSRQIAYLGRRGGIFVIDANGGTPRRIAATRKRGDHAWEVELDWSARQEIAFSDKGGTYLMRSDGSGLRRLSRRTGAPKWSPDGRRVVLSERKNIYVVDRRGHESHLTRWVSDGEPQLAPDGRRIAFVRGNGVYLDNAFVYVTNTDGGGLRRLGRGAQPRWSPDGTRVAYVQDRALPLKDRIVVADANGGLPRARIDGDEPTWSPDGSLAFMRYDYVHEDRGDHGGAQWYVVNSALVVARADGSSERTIADFDAESPDGPIAAGAPAWSPDGRTVALIFGGSVVLVNVNDGTRRTLQGLDIDPETLEWSPDGSEILATEFDTIAVIHVAAGTSEKILGLTESTVESATWAPDSATIGFVRCSADGGDCDVYAVAAQAAAKPRRLTKTIGIESGLDWGR